MKLPDATPVTVALRWSDTESTPVGRLAWRDRRAWFEYDAAWLRTAAELSPLRLRTGPGVHAGDMTLGGLHGVFADSLPDAWGRLLVDRSARSAGISPASLTALDRLCIVGERAIGALIYQPATAWPEGGVVSTLDQLAEQIDAVLEGTARDVLTELLAIGGSPGGAQPKVLVGWRERDDHLVHGALDVPPDHRALIVKFGAPQDADDIGPIELAYTEMARAAGLRTSPCRLLPSNQGPGFFAVDRFDRPPGVGHPRLHAHTLAGLLHADHRLPSLDYDALLRATLHVTRDHREVEAAFRYMVFNVLACNRDDHGKQFSFLMDASGKWRLAPAYDLTFSEGPGGEHSTSIAGQGRNPRLEHILALGKTASIAQPHAVFDEIQSVVARWPEFAGQAGVTRSSRLRIGERLAAISAEARD